MTKSWLLLTLTAVCFIGCKLPGVGPTALTSQTPAAQASATPKPAEGNQQSGFSFFSLLQMAGFQKPEPPAPSLAPQSVGDLGKMISAVSETSKQLSVNDPPEVTRQKAQAILQSLQGWDKTLSATTSTGLVSNEMAQTLNTWVSQLREKSQLLAQYAPDPQTIAAVQQLAGALHSTFGNFSQMLNQGSSLLGANPG